MKTCCFIGHRNVVSTPELYEKVKHTIIHLIEDSGVTHFLFGSASRFDDLCLQVVTDLKKEYTQIKRVYVRSFSSPIDKCYQDYLLTLYDDTLLPPSVENAGKASYVKRNQEMIQASDFCVFYYDKQYQPSTRKLSKRSVSFYQPKSGTKLAYEYASQKSKNGEKTIINLTQS